MAESFAPRPGCPMCSIAASARESSLPPTPLPGQTSFLRTSSTRPSSGAGSHDILWRDDNFTAYHEKASPVSSKGHVVLLFNMHVPGIYSLSTTDLPLLIAVHRIAQRLLNQISPVTVPPSPSVSAPTPGTSSLVQDLSHFNIGFISSPFKDPKIPVTDHLHVHAYIDQPDLAGWWRKVAYGPLAWYAIEDLIAEIRETSTNNRVKVKVNTRETRPIDTVPLAGARTGWANGRETTSGGVGQPDVEQGLAARRAEPEPVTPTTTTALSGATTPRRMSMQLEEIDRPPSAVPLVVRVDSVASLISTGSDRELITDRESIIDREQTASPVVELQLEREVADPASPVVVDSPEPSSPPVIAVADSTTETIDVTDAATTSDAATTIDAPTTNDAPTVTVTTTAA